jgi:stress-induced morphogen
MRSRRRGDATVESISVDEVRRRIEGALPGARVRVETFAGSDHFQAWVEASQFEGRSRVEQHRMVYAALEGLFGGAMHALALRTAVPGEPAANPESRRTETP